MESPPLAIQISTIKQNWKRLLAWLVIQEEGAERFKIKAKGSKAHNPHLTL